MKFSISKTPYEFLLDLKLLVGKQEKNIEDFFINIIKKNEVLDLILERDFDPFLSQIPLITGVSNAIKQLQDAYPEFSKPLPQKYLPQLKANEQIERIPKNRQNNALFLFYFFWKYQRKIYYFEKEITEILQNTTLKGLHTDFISTPHPALHLSLPYSTLTFKDVILRSIYIYCIKTTQELVAAYSLPNKTKYMFRYIAFGKKISDNDDEYHYIDDYKICLSDGDLFQQIENDLNTQEKNLEDYQKLHSFIINAILYIMANSARVEYFQTKLKNDYNGDNPKKQRRADKDNRSISKIPAFYYIGRDFQPTGNITNRKISVKFKVRSHWHTYRIGPGKSGSILKLIAEYVKGPDLVEAIEKNLTKVF